MSSSAAKRQVAGAPAPQLVFPDEILEEIFLRVDAVEDLVRASAACTTFRRVVSSRRFRRLYPAPVLGVLEFDAPGRFLQAEPPHRSAPATRALAQAADFTFSFLDAPHCWHICDARDSRVLLCRRVGVAGAFADLMVCDPLHRRHVQLPPIPDDLAAATGGWGMQEFDSFLDPFLDSESDEDKEKPDFSFRVICAVQCENKLVTFHFSSVTGQWRGITINRPMPLDPFFVSFQKMFERHYAHGCIFWTISIVSSFMIMLNMHDMKLSVVDLPPGSHGNPRARAVVEAGEGMIGLFTLSDGMLKLYCKSLQGIEWQQQRIIPLPKPNSYWNIVGAAAGYLLLKAIPQDHSHFEKRESQYFTLNLKTFLVEGLCVSNNQYTRGALLYASFLSSFSLPSI